MQVVLLRVVRAVGRGVRAVRLVAGRGARLALDVEQRRVGQEGGRGGQAQRVLRVLSVRVAGCVWVCVRVRVRVRVRGALAGRLAGLARRVARHRRRQRQRHLGYAGLALINAR